MSDDHSGGAIVGVIGAAVAAITVLWAKFGPTGRREEKSQRDQVSRLEREIERHQQECDAAIDRRDKMIELREREIAGLREELRIERNLRSEDRGFIERLRAKLETAQMQARKAKAGMPDEFIETNFGSLDDNGVPKKGPA